jgi:hypothetical protein
LLTKLLLFLLLLLLGFLTKLSSSSSCRYKEYARCSVLQGSGAFSHRRNLLTCSSGNSLQSNAERQR